MSDKQNIRDVNAITKFALRFLRSNLGDVDVIEALNDNTKLNLNEEAYDLFLARAAGDPVGVQNEPKLGTLAESSTNPTCTEAAKHEEESQEEEGKSTAGQE